ncbi:exodeoxyribonuclease VII large subunit [Parvularcula sp. IMCC14364]|uniref:exodeoxyribonuclease VII large subunit n=1 Tax=Parvularcula sp. IMCC14364 TaxID=3067902 RepID=UPI002740F6C9|nr:exodeoxyribonuclease VII large subunit [Parvularcula sp. IMCC14364]
MSNIREYTVSELSGDVKRVVEDSFSYVRVRGEMGRVTRAGSGHVYLDLKDDRAVISGVVWKGNASKLKIQPEQGMEMIATGRLTTYPGQSKYQLVIDTLEPAGAGALMALLEERRKKLAAEGLFDDARKKPLPFLPGVIGVVTSPSGAVIRDILHRLRDRFPSHVLVWPTLVQGEGAAARIVAGIEGFNAMSANGVVPRPDVLIVARGGGSIEDLWCFNEEAVVRAAAGSKIPLISAVGHETDTTLIDFAADQRAPTPTAAAEIAVPVRRDLWQEVQNKVRRMGATQSRTLEARQMALTSAMRGLGRADTLLEIPTQRLDRAADRLGQALRIRIERGETELGRKASGLRPVALSRNLQARMEGLGAASARLKSTAPRLFDAREARLESASRLLDTLSYRNVLARGFALALDTEGNVVRRAADVQDGMAAGIQFADGVRDAVFRDKGAEAGTSKPKAKKKAPGKPLSQSSLFD